MAALAFATTSGCAGDSPKEPGKAKARSSAKARCAGQECRVRAVCKGKLHVRLGPAPVMIKTTKTALVTTIYVDFAGSRNDAVIRC